MEHGSPESTNIQCCEISTAVPCRARRREACAASPVPRPTHSVLHLDAASCWPRTLRAISRARCTSKGMLTFLAHMRSHRGDAQNASTVALATPSKPLFREHGRALWCKAQHIVCEVEAFGGTVLNCSYCNLVRHQTCAVRAAVPAGYLMCPGCVFAEVEGHVITRHGAGVEDMDGSEIDDDGGMDGSFESAETFGEAVFIAHGVQSISGLWDATDDEALRGTLNCDCEPMPTSLTEVDMMLSNISKAYGTPLSAMQEFDPVLQNVILKMFGSLNLSVWFRRTRRTLHLRCFVSLKGTALPWSRRSSADRAFGWTPPKRAYFHASMQSYNNPVASKEYKTKQQPRAGWDRRLVHSL
jgi:hypothetical protein